MKILLALLALTSSTIPPGFTAHGKAFITLLT